MDVKYVRAEIEKKYDECHATWERTDDAGIAALRLQFATFWNWVDEFIGEQDVYSEQSEVKDGR